MKSYVTFFPMDENFIFDVLFRLCMHRKGRKEGRKGEKTCLVKVESKNKLEPKFRLSLAQ
jgi:hypothetical protein